MFGFFNRVDKVIWPPERDSSTAALLSAHNRFLCEHRQCIQRSEVRVTYPAIQMHTHACYSLRKFSLRTF